MTSTIGQLMLHGSSLLDLRAYALRKACIVDLLLHCLPYSSSVPSLGLAVATHVGRLRRCALECVAVLAYACSGPMRACICE